MFRIAETWRELTDSGRIVTRKRLEFGSIPEQLVYLRQMINVYRGTQWARTLAMQIITDARCPDRNKACYAKAIAEAVQQRVRYVNELPETFQTPPNTWRWAYGDCDDHTTLIGSLIESLGITVEVVGMKVNGGWRHVFPRALIPIDEKRKVRMPLDSTLRNTPIEAFANPITRAKKRGMRVELYIPPSGEPG